LVGPQYFVYFKYLTPCGILFPFLHYIIKEIKSVVKASSREQGPRTDRRQYDSDTSPNTASGIKITLKITFLFINSVDDSAKLSRTRLLQSIGFLGFPIRYLLWRIFGMFLIISHNSKFCKLFYINLNRSNI